MRDAIERMRLERKWALLLAAAALAVFAAFYVAVHELPDTSPVTGAVR